MKIAVMGAGGIGSYLAARLSRAGHEVTVVCRGKHLQAIRTQGLHLRHGGAILPVPGLQATDDCGSVGMVDVVIMGVKLYDLAAASEQIRPMVGPHTLVVPIQNGVNAHEVVNAALGGDHCIPGTVFISATVEQPGLVVGRGSSDRIVFGELDGSESPRTVAFRDACISAGLDPLLSRHVLADLWSKFVVVVGSSAVCCLARQSVGYVYEDAALRALLLQGFQEAMRVAKALGIGIDADADQKAMAFVRTVDYATRISMLQDMEAGKRTELAWMSGHLLELARRLGVDVPLHATAVACLKPFSGGHA